MSNTIYPDAISYKLRRQLTPFTACFRGLGVACHILYGMLIAFMLPLLDNTAKRSVLKHWSRRLLDILHVGLETHGLDHPTTGQGRLLVANHISWLDAVALNAASPACFIVKSEVRDWPLLGWMCHRANYLFVKRDIRRDTVRINRQIAEIIKHGESIAIFPEGTTTDDVYPGHFHSSLLQCPIDIGAPVHPVAIRYHDGCGNPSGDAAYVADMTFIQSLWKVLNSPSLHVTLAYLPALHCAGKNRRMLASEAQGAIHTALAILSCRDSVHIPDGAAMPPRLLNADQPHSTSLPTPAIPACPKPPARMMRAHFINS